MSLSSSLDFSSSEPAPTPACKVSLIVTLLVPFPACLPVPVMVYRACHGQSTNENMRLKSTWSKNRNLVQTSARNTN